MILERNMELVHGETDEHGKIVVDALGKNRKSVIQNNSIAPEINQLYINENQNPMQELIKAYDNVNPRLHDLLERGYKEYVGREYVDRVDIHDIED
jgi:ribosomal protein S7